jgi:acetate kinase
MGMVLVVNAGSSSLKFALLDPLTGQRAAEGIAERIGEQGSAITFSPADGDDQVIEADIVDHSQAFATARDLLSAAGMPMPELVGHRVVHGGDRLTEPTLIDDEVLAQIEACVPLAPLHNPGALSGIRAAREQFPQAAHVAVFDTAFHATIPEAAREYAIDREVAREHSIRRYGFHGTSHQYVAQQAADLLGKDLDGFNAVTLHLGNGASACAVRGGKSVETSMGVTPLEGLVMGTRSGDIDPSVPIMLLRAGWDADAVDDLLNRRGGLRGLCGANDLREIRARVAEGDEAAALAREVMVHRLRKYLGAYSFVLGRVDAVVFTAGVGEHDDWVRAHVCRDLGAFGIELDEEVNADYSGGVARVSAPTSDVAILVVPTDEEYAIAQQAQSLIG